MDMNGHINNVTYVAWALETVPIEIYLNYTLIQAMIPSFLSFSGAKPAVTAVLRIPPRLPFLLP